MWIPGTSPKDKEKTVITNFDINYKDYYEERRKQFLENRGIETEIVNEAYDSEGRLMEDHYALVSKDPFARIQWIRFVKAPNVKLKRVKRK